MLVKREIPYDNNYALIICAHLMCLIDSSGLDFQLRLMNRN